MAFLRSKTALLAVALLATMGCDDESSTTAEPTEDAAIMVDGAVTADMGAEADAAEAEPDAEVVLEDDTPFTANLDLPAEYYNYANPEIPEHYRVETLGFHGQGPVMGDDNTPADNLTTDAGATLGRVLFWDANLSANRTVSCASCHKPEFGFSDDRVLSKGFLDGDTGRHSMGLTNARFYAGERFFWDQRAATLEDQVLMPFQDPVEMGMSLETLVMRVQAGDYYPALFTAAFGDDMVDADRISKALAQFVRSMVSTGSKYDIGRAQVGSRAARFPNFTEQENAGKAFVVQPPPRGGLGCFVCHNGESFSAMEATNNGLDATNEVDPGYGGVTERASDAGKFKVPSLRNVALRAPYMHDGRFADLSEVLDHYSEGMQPNPSLGAPYGVTNGEATRLNLTTAEKNAVIAFLHTLTDLDMVNDPKFSDPFIVE
jgi:cytochrome c peroxidase